MRNEFHPISEVAFDHPSLPSWFPDTEEILLLSQQENERIERACEGDSLPYCVSLRIPWETVIAQRHDFERHSMTHNGNSCI